MGQQHSAHIANAYDKPILVLVDKDRCYLTSFNSSTAVKGSAKGVGVSASQSVGATYYWDLAHKKGFTKINAHTFLEFRIQVEQQHHKIYISAYSEDGVVEVSNWPVDSDSSAIIKADGQIVGTEYGRIWVDKYGHRHS